jgi:hypothetical protein
MDSVPVVVVPMWEAEMTAKVLEDTVTVETVKLADALPAATVTLDGTAISSYTGKFIHIE